LHVKAMAKKVDEIMTDERFQKGSREATSKFSHLLPISPDFTDKHSQTNGSTPTQKPTLSAACMPSASTPSIQDTLTSASKPAHQQRLQLGLSRSSPMRLSFNVTLTLICAH
jgi:hypothetical protein